MVIYSSLTPFRSPIPNSIKNYHKRSSDSFEPEIFVDMYCGIGYFTLPVLVKCDNTIVSEVWACDWNLTAVQVSLPYNRSNKDHLLA